MKEKSLKPKRRVRRARGADEKALKLQVEALRLRADKKMSFTAIGKELGISTACAYNYVERAMDALRPHLEEKGFKIWEHKFHAVETLQDLIGHWFPVATAPGVLKEKLEDGAVILGDGTDSAVQASHICINAVKEIAKILGLNAPLKVDGKVEHRPAVPLDELAARAARLTSRSDLTAALLPAYLNPPGGPGKN